MEKEKKFSGLFSFDGEVTTKEALPLAFQHVVAMIASCITPPLMLAGASGLSPKDTIILIQIALIGSALTSLLMVYPIKMIGSRLPMIFGVSFAFAPTMIALSNQFGARGPAEVVAIVLGAQIVGGICSILFGLGLKYIMPLFPPLVSGTVVLVIGLSLYPVAMNYMGGAGSVEVAGWGAWQNWLVGAITLILGLGFAHFGKGMFKLANVLFAMIIGYIISIFFGMVDFSPVREAGWISVVEPFHFGFSFEPSAIISIVIIFIVTAIEGIGDMTSTTVGGMDRIPTPKELRGGIVGFGFANIVGAIFGCLPTATFSQNAGIVSINKVVNKKVFTLASLIILVSGLVPKLSSILTTIPYPVLGGATLSVFAAITMNGIRMITSQPLSARNTSIVGVSVALGVGFTTVAASAQNAGVVFMPEELAVAIGSSPVVLATISAVLMNLIIPEKEEDKAKEDSLANLELEELEEE